MYKIGSNEEYIIFKLGGSFQLDNSIEGVPVRSTAGAIAFVDYGKLL